MPASLPIILTTLLAYLLGGLPFGYWFVRLSTGKDIRSMGSGNIGATNVHRTSGGKAGIVVLLLDILKGYLAVLIAGVVNGGDANALALAVVAVVVGHCYPVFLRFKGGKAVACFVGAFLYVAPLALGITTLVFLAIFALTKYVSLASIVGALVFPLILWRLQTYPFPILLAGIATALLIVFRHRANIERLLKGEEHVFSLKGGKTA
ncbi:MAG: glycerol-3-phosphate 1-O-acyltransferase PlsY [Bryobacteraceae bacterium]